MSDNTNSVPISRRDSATSGSNKDTINVVSGNDNVTTTITTPTTITTTTITDSTITTPTITTPNITTPNITTPTTIPDADGCGCHAHAGAVALVTGAGVRVGRSIAQALHRDGYRVAIHCNRALEQANDLKDNFNRTRADSAIVLQADLCHDTAATCSSLVHAVVKKWGSLDLLVNNAANFIKTPIGEITEENWTTVLDTNLKAPVFLAQAALPHLRAVGGSIVNLADLTGERPSARHLTHSVSKAGLAAATKALALAAAPEVRVNAVSPGAVDWPEVDEEHFAAIKQDYVQRTPLGRVGQPHEAAEVVVFLASSRASFITGQIIGVDGGRSLPL